MLLKLKTGFGILPTKKKKKKTGFGGENIVLNFSTSIESRKLNQQESVCFMEKWLLIKWAGHAANTRLSV